MKKKIKSPCSGWAAMVPVILQLETLECGVSQNGPNAENTIVTASSCRVKARGIVKVLMEYFDWSFTGICIFLKSDEGILPDRKRKNIWMFARKQLEGYGESQLFTMLVSLIVTILSVINLVFCRGVIDKMLGAETWNGSHRFSVPDFFALIQILLSSIQESCSRRIEEKLAIRAKAQYMWHMLHMLIEFFSQHHAKDIVTGKRMNLTRMELRDEEKLVSGIEMMETVKASGAENGYSEKWSGYQASVKTQRVKAERISNYFDLFLAAVDSIVDTVILTLGLFLILQGNYTVDMLFALQTMLSSLMTSVRSFSKVSTDIYEMRVNMERIKKVMEYPMDVKYNEKEKDVPYGKLRRKVSCRYRRK